jgi:hypothetical protein
MTSFAAALITLVLALVPAGVPAAEDFTGKWSGVFSMIAPDGSARDEKIFLDLKHAGAALTGTAGPALDKQWPIVKGAVDGNKVTFEVQSDGPLVKFTLTFAEGRLKGDAAADFEGQKLSAKVDAERVK